MTDHWQDVLAGSTLGLCVAYFSYRQYYPHLASKRAHIPFTTRFDLEQVKDDMDSGTTVFRDGDADEEENVGLIGGSREPRTVPEHAI